MKVCFPKNVQQQTTSQSDSGLGEENNYRKHGSASQTVCKKCGSCDSVCQNCKTVKDCKCGTVMKTQPNINEDSEGQSFLPPAQQSRKSSLNSKNDLSSEYVML